MKCDLFWRPKLNAPCQLAALPIKKGVFMSCSHLGIALVIMTRNECIVPTPSLIFLIQSHFLQFFPVRPSEECKRAKALSLPTLMVVCAAQDWSLNHQVWHRRAASLIYLPRLASMSWSAASISCRICASASGVSASNLSTRIGWVFEARTSPQPRSKVMRAPSVSSTGNP